MSWPSCSALCLDGFGFPSWVYFSKDVSLLTVLLQFVSDLNLRFHDNIIYFGFLKASSFGLCIYFAQGDFISSPGISWHFPRKSYLFPQEAIFLSPGSHTSFPKKPYIYPQKVVSFCNPPWQQIASLFIWDSLHITLSRRSASVKEEVETRSRWNTRILGKTWYFLSASSECW